MFSFVCYLTFYWPLNCFWNKTVYSFNFLLILLLPATVFLSLQPIIVWLLLWCYTFFAISYLLLWIFFFSCHYCFFCVLPLLCAFCFPFLKSRLSRHSSLANVSLFPLCVHFSLILFSPLGALNRPLKTNKTK